MDKKEYLKRYAQEHKEYLKEYKRLYAQKNKQKIKEYRKRYSTEHKDHRVRDQKEYKKQWHQKNKERLNKKSAEYQINNREKINKDHLRWKKENLERYNNMRAKCRYNLTLQQIDNMIMAQSNKCAICEKSLVQGKRCVDHDHKTNKVRGILCHTCNLALGMFKDDIEMFKRAISYLEKSQMGDVNDKLLE